jgi:hypothetical protein
MRDKVSAESVSKNPVQAEYFCFSKAWLTPRLQYMVFITGIGNQGITEHGFKP